MVLIVQGPLRSTLQPIARISPARWLVSGPLNAPHTEIILAMGCAAVVLMWRQVPTVPSPADVLIYYVVQTLAIDVGL